MLDTSFWCLNTVFGYRKSFGTISSGQEQAEWAVGDQGALCVITWLKSVLETCFIQTIDFFGIGNHFRQLGAFHIFLNFVLKK